MARHRAPRAEAETAEPPLGSEPAPAPAPAPEPAPPPASEDERVLVIYGGGNRSGSLMHGTLVMNVGEPVWLAKAEFARLREELPWHKFYVVKAAYGPGATALGLDSRTD